MEKHEKCREHTVIEFKSNLSMGLLGANLLGVIGIAAAVAWAMLSGIPAMESRLAEKIDIVNEKTAVMDKRIVALEQVATIYLKDIEHYRDDK